jgi:hypothetical protein
MAKERVCRQKTMHSAARRPMISDMPPQMKPLARLTKPTSDQIRPASAGLRLPAFNAWAAKKVV